MPANQFEDSRIAAGTIQRGGLKPGIHNRPAESAAISRDDVRDGAASLYNDRKEHHMSTHLETMNDLFLDEIRDLYDAEKQLTKALPKMAKAAATPELKAAFENHLQQTQGHVDRLEEIFETLGEKGTGKKCAAMAGLIKEGEAIVGETDEGSLRDAGIIVAAQKVEHYEMSGYGSARTHAVILGHREIASRLEETLREEKAADRKLNDIALTLVNVEAVGRPTTRTAGGN